MAYSTPQGIFGWEIPFFGRDVSGWKSTYPYRSGHAHNRRCVESTNRGLGIPRIVTEFISSSHPNPNADSDWLEEDSAAGARSHFPFVTRADQRFPLCRFSKLAPSTVS